MEYLKRIRKSLSKYKNIKIKVLNEDKLKKLGLNLILAVNKGSNNPALLVVIEYINKNESYLSVNYTKYMCFDIKYYI